jgi:hypothetical protein
MLKSNNKQIETHVVNEISNVPSLNLNDAGSITYEKELSGAYCVKSRFKHMMILN